MDYLNGTHIAKWQWDLMHDPGVIVRVFEKDADAMKVGGFVTDAEYLIHDGNYADLENGLYRLYKSSASDAMKNLFSTKTVNDFLKKICTSKVLNNLIFEAGHASSQASTTIGFLVLQKTGTNVGMDFVEIKDPILTEESYKQSKLCINIWFAGSPNDHVLAHELLIHDVRYFDEITQIDFKNISKEVAINKLTDILSHGRYTDSDGGHKDHYNFIIGEKKEMTEYTLERLEQMQTMNDKLNYLCKYISELKKYLSEKEIQEQNGGYNNIVTKIKQYLERDFGNYKSYIFEPLNKLDIEDGRWPSDLSNFDKNKTLWEKYMKK
jgi:hypothetical protein